MAFDDLTSSQRDALIPLIEALRTGKFRDEFFLLWKEGRPRGEIDLTYKHSKSGGQMLPGFTENEVHAFQEEGYVTTPTDAGAELKIKAFVEYEKYKAQLPPPESPEPIPSASSPQRNQVFISYSHKDKKILEQLQTILKPLVRGKKISVWDDTEIKSGDEWREEIKKAIASAKVAVLLVSPDFLASDFIAEHELPPLLEAARKEGVRVLWVAVRPSLYEETEIALYQAVNDPKRPLSKLSGSGREEELVRICREIKAAASVKNQEEIQSPPADTADLLTNASSIRIEQTNPVNSPAVIGNNNQVTLGRQFPPEISFCPDRDLVQSEDWDYTKLGCSEITIPWDAPGWEKVVAEADLTVLVLAPPDTSPVAHLRIVEVGSKEAVALQVVREIRSSPNRVEYQNVKLTIPRTNGTRSYRLEFKTEDKAAVKIAGSIKFVGTPAPTPVQAVPTPAPDPDLHGLLIPGNDPRPPLPRGCQSEDNPVLVLGSCAFVANKEWSGVLDIYGQQLLTVRREAGGITVSARVVSSANNRVVAQITNNEFYVNPSTEFRMQREDWHTLKVVDSRGSIALYVRYLNLTTITIMGAFYVNDAPVIINQQGIRIGGGMIMECCFNSSQSEKGAVFGVDPPRSAEKQD